MENPDPLALKNINNKAIHSFFISNNYLKFIDNHILNLITKRTLHYFNDPISENGDIRKNKIKFNEIMMDIGINIESQNHNTYSQVRYDKDLEKNEKYIIDTLSHYLSPLYVTRCENEYYGFTSIHNIIMNKIKIYFEIDFQVEMNEIYFDLQKFKLDFKKIYEKSERDIKLIRKLYTNFYIDILRSTIDDKLYHRMLSLFLKEERLNLIYFPDLFSNLLENDDLKIKINNLLINSLNQTPKGLKCKFINDELDTMKTFNIFSNFGIKVIEKDEIIVEEYLENSGGGVCGLKSIAQYLTNNENDYEKLIWIRPMYYDNRPKNTYSEMYELILLSYILGLKLIIKNDKITYECGYGNNICPIMNLGNNHWVLIKKYNYKNKEIVSNNNNIITNVIKKKISNIEIIDNNNDIQKEKKEEILKFIKKSLDNDEILNSFKVKSKFLNNQLSNNNSSIKNIIRNEREKIDNLEEEFDEESYADKNLEIFKESIEKNKKDTAIYKEIPNIFAIDILNDDLLTDYYNMIPSHLEEFLLTDVISSVEYEYDFDNVQIKEHKFKQEVRDRKTNYRPKIPSRIALPMIEYPISLKNYFINGDKNNLNNIQAMIINELDDLRSIMNFFRNSRKLSSLELITEMDALEKDINQCNIDEKNFVNTFINKLSYEFTLNEFRSFTKTENVDHTYMRLDVDFPTIIFYFQSIKTYMSNVSGTKDISNINDLNNVKETSLFKANNGILIHFFYTRETMIITVLSEFFLFIINEERNKIYFYTATEFDYILTQSEIKLNMTYLIRSNEYKNYHTMFKFLLEFSDLSVDYDLKVDFMKSFETLCLNKVDIINTNTVSWQPIMDLLKSISCTLSKILLKKISLCNVLLAFLGLRIDKEELSIFYEFFLSLKENTGLELLELSSAHKFVYYSKVDETMGVTKYYKRVHTKRQVGLGAAKEVANLFKREFIYEFANRENMLPELVTTDEKKNILQLHLTSKNLKALNELELGFFDDMHLGESLCKPICSDPLEYAKDKSCSTEEVSYKKRDSTPELYELLLQQDYELTKLEYDDLNQNENRSINFIYGDHPKVKPLYPVKLSMKEREQKKEGRLFGSATMKNKHKLSLLTDMQKLALNFIRGEMMTISDKDRKMVIHDAGQYLASGNYFSLLLDIEGHNQSIQPDNFNELLKEVGNVLGLNNLHKLNSLFSNLTVFYPYAFEEKAFVSKGQLGGIEGWNNPGWTLFTVLIVKLFSIKNNIPIKIIMNYSDDIALIIHKDELKKLGTNQLYRLLVSHFLYYGFIIKPSQTMISSNRITMLRQHYFQGHRADSAIKRLLSNTLFNENFTQNIQLECMGISSSISSSYELSNHIVLPTFIKYHKALFLTYRTFLEYMRKQFSQPHLEIEKYDPSTFEKMKFIEAIQGGWIKYIKRNSVNENSIENIMNMYITSDIEKEFLSGKRTDLSLEIFNTFFTREISILTYTSIFMRSLFIKKIYLLYLLVPKEFGGCGLDSIYSQFLSGHSIGFFKNMTYTEMILNTYDGNHESNRSLLINSVLPMNKEEISDYKLTASEFPSQGKYDSAINVFFKFMSSRLKITNRNTKIALLLDTRESIIDFQKRLLEINKERFFIRIVSYFFEHSFVYIYNLLVKKLETSTNLIKRLDNKNNLKKKLFSHNLDSLYFLFKKKINIDTNIHRSDDILDILLDIRRELYVNVNIVDIIEPLYEHHYTTCVDNAEFFSIDRVPKHYHDDNTQKLKAPIYGNETTFKEYRSMDRLIFKETSHFLAFELVTTTKWLLFNAMNNGLECHLLNNNITIMCDLTLSTISGITYLELEPYVNLPRGGEIYHRLENLRFRSGSNIRILPSITIEYSETFNQEMISRLDLEDSNINFEYLKMRYILLSAVIHYLGGHSQLLRKYKYDIDPKVKRVPNNYILKRDYKIETIEKSLKSDFIIEDYKRKISYMTLMTLDMQNETQRCIIPFGIYKSLEDNKNIDYLTALLLKYKQVADQCDLKLKPNFYPKLILENMYFSFSNYMKLLNNKATIPEYDKFQDLFNQVFNHVDIRSLNMPKRVPREFFKMFVTNLVLQLRSILSDYEYSKLTNKISSFNLDVFENLNDIDLFDIEDNWLEDDYTIDEKIRIYLSIIFIVTQISITELDKDIPRYSLKEIKFSLDYINTRKRTFQLGDFVSMYNKNVIKIEEIIITVNKLGQKIVNLINYQLENYIEKVVELPIPVKEIPLFDAVYEIMEDKEIQPYMVNVDIISIKNVDFINIDNFIKMYKYYKKMAMMYSQSTLYQSETGSDIAIIAANIMKKMIEWKFLNRDELVLNYCGGRGDFFTAAQGLRLKIETYSRKDPYSLSYKIYEGIIYRDYDIFDFNNLPGFRSNSVVIIDISFIKGDPSKIIDLIKNIISCNCKILIRFDNFMNSMNDLLNLVRSNFLNINIITPSDSNSLIPYIYLILTPIRSKGYFSKEVSSMSSLNSYFMKPIHQSIEKTAYLETSTIITLNSISIQLFLIDNPLKLLKTLAETAVSNDYKKISNMIAREEISISDFYIPDYMIPSDLERENMQIHYKHNIESLGLDIINMNNVYYRKMNNYEKRRVDKLLIDFREEFKFYKINDKIMSEKLLINIRKKHPDSKLRELSRSYLKLIKGHSLTFPISEEMIILNMSALLKRFESEEVFKGKFLNEALIYLIIALIFKDFNVVLRSLIRSYYIGGDNRNKVPLLVNKFRKMRPVFNYLQKELDYHTMLEYIHNNVVNVHELYKEINKKIYLMGKHKFRNIKVRENTINNKKTELKNITNANNEELTAFMNDFLENVGTLLSNEPAIIGMVGNQEILSEMGTKLNEVTPISMETEFVDAFEFDDLMNDFDQFMDQQEAEFFNDKVILNEDIIPNIELQMDQRVYMMLSTLDRIMWFHSFDDDDKIMVHKWFDVGIDVVKEKFNVDFYHKSFDEPKDILLKSLYNELETELGLDDLLMMDLDDDQENNQCDPNIALFHHDEPEENQE